LIATVITAALPASALALGGPVILGGDDLTDHGSTDSTTGASLNGWLYIEKAIANIKPKVVRPNNSSIAVIGSSDPGPVLPGSGGDAGMAIKNAAQKNGMTVQYFEGAVAINSGMSQIASGSYRPAIIWVAGDAASNDLDTPGPCTDADPMNQTEGEALAANANVLNNFVNQGGGLMSHGTCYPWLSALIPGLTTPQSGGGGLFLTPAGATAFPGLTNGDLNTGPWHNHFEGNFGGLDVLVRSTNVQAPAGTDAAVIIGGGQVSLTEKPADLSITKADSPDPVTAGQNLTYTLTVRNNGPNPATGVTVTDTLPSGATARSTSASQGSCSGTTTVTCNLGNLASGATATVRIVIRPNAAGTLQNSATVSGNQPDPNQANNTAKSGTTVKAGTTPPAGDQAAPRITIAGVRGLRRSCTRRSFRVRIRVRESRLRRVDVLLDGRRIRRTSRKRFSVRVPARAIRAGRHRLTIVATDRAGNRRVVRRVFRRCSVKPRFTG